MPEFAQCVPELTASPLFPGWYAVGSRDLDSYIVVPENKLRVALDITARMDGTRPLGAIAEDYRRTHGKSVDVSTLHQRLSDAGLLVGSAPKGELALLSVTLLDFPIAPLVPALTLLSRVFRPLVGLSGLVVAAAMFLAAARFQEWSLSITEPVGFTTATLLWVIPLCVVFTILWHELSHALTGVRYGLTPTSLRVVAYLMMIPLFVIKIPGVFTLTPRRRIAVWAAGIWGSLTLGAISTLVVFAGPPAGPWRHVAGRMAVANTIVAAANLVPFMITDGYFILSTLCRKANIRRQGWRQLQDLLRSGRLGSLPLLLYMAVSVLMIGFLVVRNLQRLQWLYQHWTAAFVCLLAWISFAVTAKVWKVRALRRNGSGG